MRTQLKVVGASRLSHKIAIATFSLVVPGQSCDRTGMMHGGAVPLTLDMATTLAQAPFAAPGYWESGGANRDMFEADTKVR